MASDINDLIVLSNRIKNHTNYSRVHSIIKIMRQVVLERTQLLDNPVSNPARSKQVLQDLYHQLERLLTENNRCTTWFPKIIDRYCSNDPELKQRLNYFIQRTLGPVLKLSEGVQGDKRSLVIEFPNQGIRDVFLSRYRIKEEQKSEETDSISIDGNAIFFPATLSKNQQLEVTFPTVKAKERLIHMLNLAKANLVASNPNECTLYIHDRRIHDTASRFYIAVVCPYFAEYYKIQYASHMLAQAYRDGNSFFSPTRFPTELTLKIAADSSSSDAISEDEKRQIAYDNFHQL
ncbi:Dot/Icm T4SS effector [Legionella steigerwaltii]|uniref:Dot/Icm T4SS effector n=2 Tax=Legionella steigerwaltii TaxID=460 RepID=A0A378L4F8_9GAMM|nr:Dot/Icm T4SS effector [Legionella steigerwaltii]STY21683.1 Dot/Icm T4SS effector [Legionella steigerwaltii]